MVFEKKKRSRGEIKHNNKFRIKKIKLQKMTEITFVSLNFWIILETYICIPQICTYERN